MSPGLDRGRRAAVLVGMIALLVPAVVHAQDPRAAEVQLAAREWLADADRLDAQATWECCRASFSEGDDGAALGVRSTANASTRRSRAACHRRNRVPASLQPAAAEATSRSYCSAHRSRSGAWKRAGDAGTRSGWRLARDRYLIR
jgi:hypothetical protein